MRSTAAASSSGPPTRAGWPVGIQDHPSVAVADLRELPRQLDAFEIPDERLNPNGGAVAIGHLFGSSGTR
jgi:acetyl-CoA acetyltransferase